MHITILFDRRGRTREEGKKGSIELDIYFGRGDRKFFSTGVTVEKRFWDDHKKKVINHTRKENLNLKIQNLIEEITAWEREVLLRKGITTSNDLKAFLGKKTEFESLNAFFWEQLSRDEPRISKGTYIARKAVLNRFDQYGKFSPYGFDRNELERYHNYLLNEMQPQSTRNHHKIIDLYLKRAENEKLIEKNPYHFFQKPKTRNRPVFLTGEELNRIRKYKGIVRIEKARDLFLFQCLTGMPYSDMQLLKPSDIKEGRFIYKPRQKTGEIQMIPLLPESKEILERFSGHAYCFPRISNQKLNAYLKELATIKDIEKPLTTHVGRHTFATLMLEKGLPLETISHILGHASTKTTSIYAKMQITKIEGDLKRLNITSI